jgi:PHP family Zn ribbon phosphoesterase
MGKVNVICPQTGKYFEVGLEMDRTSFETVRLEGNQSPCPHCGAVHTWGTDEARLIEMIDP